MGRIKAPAGSIFRRESKPGYMAQAEAVKGKNWNLTLNDTVKILGAAEKLYTSPLVRDVIGGVGEIGAGVAGLFDTDDEEEVSVEEAAAASLKAAQEKHAKVREEVATDMALDLPMAPVLQAKLTEPESLQQRDEEWYVPQPQIEPDIMLDPTRRDKRPLAAGGLIAPSASPPAGIPVPLGFERELTTPAGIQPGVLQAPVLERGPLGLEPLTPEVPYQPRGPRVLEKDISLEEYAARGPVAPAEVAPRAYPPEILDKPFSQKELAKALKLLASQGIHDLSDVRQMINDLSQIPGLASQVSGVPTEQRPQFLADMAVLVSQLTPATPAPAAGIDKFRIEPGMNLGQAQAIAAHLANVGGTQADLATLLEDVENITGVSSVEGGFGRWVAGGRSGGYFMDPGMAAAAVKKAYDTGTAARTSGQSKALMDAYRRAQIAKIATGEERKERQFGLKTRKTEQDMRKKEQEMALNAAEFNYNFKVDLYKKWLDVAAKQVDLADDILEKGRRKQKSGVRDKALTDYRNMIKSGADDIQRFARGSMRKLADDKEKLNAAMARIGKRYKGIETADLTQDEIIALYGSDMKAYRQDMREGEELTEQEIANLKEIMQRRINTIISKSSRLMPMTERMTKLQEDIYQVIIGGGTRLQKKEKIDGYNKELTRLRNELNKLIGGWETK